MKRLIHTTHIRTMSMPMIMSTTTSFFCRGINNYSLSSKKHCRSRNCIFQRNSKHFSRINNSCSKKIFKSSLFCIKTIINLIRFFYFFYNSISFKSCIICNLFYWILNCIFYDIKCNLLISVFKLHFIKHF